LIRTLASTPSSIRDSDRKRATLNDGVGALTYPWSTTTKKPKYSTMVLDAVTAKGTQDVLEQICKAQVNILTNNNIAARVLYDYPKIKILINLCIIYAKTLLQMSEKEYMCGKYQIDSVRKNQYKYLLGTVTTWF
jgi:hypothetical protein